MKRIGELPLLGTPGQRVAALGFTLLGAAGGFVAEGNLHPATHIDPVKLQSVSTVSIGESLKAFGNFCFNGIVYGIVDRRIAQLPNSACNQNTVTNDSNVKIINATNSNPVEQTTE